MLPNWTQNEILVNGACIHYYRTGGAIAAGKPPVVLAHGFSDNGLCWHSLADALESEYDVVMPDARGHGLSERVRPNAKLDMPADLAEVIRRLDLKSPVVGGHSMGAVVAAQLGARFPGIVRALILEDPAWFLPKPDDEIHKVITEDSPMKKWVQSLADQPLEQVMAQCRIDHPTWPEIVVEMWCLGKQQLDQNFFSSAWNANGDWQDVVRGISCPVLLITADPEKGGIITPEVAHMVIGMNSCFRIAHIPGVGHHVRFGNEALYLEAVRAFLKDL
jgi:N-formylmaleamate deformylase